MATSIDTRSDRHRAARGTPGTDQPPPQPGVDRGTTRPIDLGQVRALTEVIRHAVVQATMSTDLKAKLRWWSRYRSARRQAMALLRHDPQPRRSLSS